MIKLKNKLENEFSKRYKETNFNNNIDSNIYHFNILNDNNNLFGITDVIKIKDTSEIIIDEANTCRNSRDTLGTFKYDEEFRNINNKLTRHGETNTRNVEIFENKRR